MKGQEELGYYMTWGLAIAIVVMVIYVFYCLRVYAPLGVSPELDREEYNQLCNDFCKSLGYKDSKRFFEQCCCYREIWGYSADHKYRINSHADEECFLNFR